LILSRQKLPAFDHTQAPAQLLTRGAYVLREASGVQPKAIVIATGSEVAIAMQAADKLEADGVPTRVVSMPSHELFEQQSADYKAQVLPASVTNRVAIEAGVSFGWDRYVGDNGTIIAIDRFGASAPAGEIYQHLGITAEAVVAAVKR
jgi:transketolase